jgi:tetraacyldisaccharide 4'-kinase
LPRLETYWQTINPVSLLLWPLSLVFAAAAAARRAAHRLGLLRIRRFPVPVVVVGNITVGGSGKTPLVIWLAQHLRAAGRHPGIVSRGYGGRAARWPQKVTAASDPADVGDEAVVLAARTGCPMCVGPDRAAAVACLLEDAGVDVVLADDGMQHYALARDIEIAVIDGQRRFGNGLLLPAGPLREPVRRLRRVDLAIVNGEPAAGELAMRPVHPRVRRLAGDAEQDLAVFAGREVHAVAGIGNPQRFFDLLGRCGIRVLPHAFPDHHRYRAGDLAFATPRPILMTEKDAVKCRDLDCADCWVVSIDAQPDATFVARLNALLGKV